MEQEITVGKEAYRIGQLGAMEQFHVYRRLVPILSSLATIMMIKSPTRQTTASDEELFARGLVAMAGVLSTMKDDDVDHVVLSCLKVCKRKQGETWAPMLSASKHIMMEDVSLPELLELVSAVLQSQEGLAAFFSKVVPSSIQDAPVETGNQSTCTAEKIG